jgi:hypothetical protein
VVIPEKLILLPPHTKLEFKEHFLMALNENGNFYRSAKPKSKKGYMWAQKSEKS